MAQLIWLWGIYKSETSAFVDHPSTIYIGHRLWQSTLQKYLWCGVLDSEPLILFNYGKNDSNGTINTIVGAFTNQKLQLLLTIHPQYIWVIDYNSQLSKSTPDAMHWTRNHLFWLTNGKMTQMAHLTGLGGYLLSRNLYFCWPSINYTYRS
jgi:hypothetical protein